MADGIDDPPLDQLGNAQQDPPPQQNPAPAQDPPQVNQLPQHDLPPGAAEHAHIVGVQRGGIVQRLQRWINFVNQPEFAEMDYYAAKTRQDRGADLMKQMEEAQLDYVAALATARQPVVPVGDEFMQLEEQYFNAKTRLARRFAELAADEPRLAGAANATPNELRTIKLQMPTQENNIQNTWGYFDGNLTRWLEFKQRFTRTMHDNADISAVFKFSYLKKSLSGKPLELLRRFDVNDANYPAAWERLNQEYDKKYPIARSYLAPFFSLKAISQTQTAKELSHISNVTMETYRNLQSLGYPVEHWHMIMIHVVHGLLNSSLLYKWNLEVTKDVELNPTLDSVIAFIDRHAAASTTDTVPRPMELQIQNPQPQTNRIDHNRSQGSSRSSSQLSAHGSARSATQGATSEAKWNYPCRACGGNHKLFYCPEFNALNYSGRMNECKKKTICVRCLKGGHTVVNCHDNYVCKHPQCKPTSAQPFKDKHNSMLCPNQNKQYVAAPVQQGAAKSNESAIERKSRSKNRHPRDSD